MRIDQLRDKKLVEILRRTINAAVARGLLLSGPHAVEEQAAKA
jgi:hypothetical protein